MCISLNVFILQIKMQQQTNDEKLFYCSALVDLDISPPSIFIEINNRTNPLLSVQLHPVHDVTVRKIQYPIFFIISVTL